jgi:tight adherence protein B
MTGQELFHIVLMASVFTLIFSGWSICVLLWIVQYLRRRKRLQRRIGVVDEQTRTARTLQLWRDELQAKSASAQRRRETLTERLGRLQVEAGWRLPAHVIIAFVVGLAALVCVVPTLLGYGPWLGIASAAAILIFFWVFTQKRISERLTLSERQLVEALGIAARALRAGHPLVGAFQSIAQEIHEPVGPIFGEICQEQALGLDLQDSIQRMADVTHSTDLKLFATAVSIQMTTGGNLADVMDSLAAVMQSRIRLSRRVRVLTASSRMNKNTLLVLPVLLFLFLNIWSPDYVQVMYSTWAGRHLLGGTVLGMLFGAWVMGKLSIIRY